MNLSAVGLRAGRFDDPQRSNWEGTGLRPIYWSCWYPIGTAWRRVPNFGDGSFLRAPVHVNEPFCRRSGRSPVVLLSHGTEGTAASLDWLAHALAAAGHVVIGVDHHGNTAIEPYRAEGFLCWWERPRDLSLALDRLSGQEPQFARNLDTERVAVAGFSLGGYAALSLLGAITDMSLYRAWAGQSRFARGPREFPDVVGRLEGMLARNSVFRRSWERQSVSCRDSRIKAAFALAPAPTVRGFTLQSLSKITVPVLIAVGGSDDEAPARECADWLYEHLPNSRLYDLGADVGHYTLLAQCTAAGKSSEPHLCVDKPGVDRAKVHEDICRVVIEALGK